MESRSFDPTQLLAHATWARRLAQTLVSPGDVDDVLQDTLIKGLQHGAPLKEPRAWLTTVMRNLGRARRRSEQRRRTREAAAQVHEAPPSADETLARVHLQQALVGRVTALDEPYRQTLLLRYFDGLSSAQIARRLGIPASTVRFRLKIAIERLRQDLDRDAPTWRREWALVLPLPPALSLPPVVSAPAGLVRGAAGGGGLGLAGKLAVLALVTLVTAGALVASGLPESIAPVPLVDLPAPAQLHQGVGTARAPGNAGVAVPGADRRSVDATLFETTRPAGLLPLEQIPPHVRAAFVIGQDRGFYQHGGFDLQAMARALWANTRAGALVQGGSTITQQLAKQVLPPELPARSLGRKLRELRLALDLEQRYTKDEILTLYLDRVFFGHGAFGLVAGAQRFFGKQARDLDVGEAALLAGLVHAPAAGSPYTHPEKARALRDQVLAALVENGVLTSAAAAGHRARAVPSAR